MSKENPYNITLPVSRRGRKSAEQKRIYDEQLLAFANALKYIQKNVLILNGRRFKVSSRGWAYQLETFNIIDKSQFDYAQDLVNKCRKLGLLPIDFVASDNSRSFDNVESIEGEHKNPIIYLMEKLAMEIKFREKWKADEVGFWLSQEYYVQMMVEKVDVKTIFKQICRKYHIPLGNAKGWSDINMRGVMIEKFKEAEKLKLKPVLLYFTDFDPKGLQIAEKLKPNLMQLIGGTGWNPKNLIVDVFGLTFDFIEKHKLTWIDNLITGSGEDLANPKHRDHKQPYVQDYIKKYGVRKCEANAIVVKPDIAVDLCRETILKYMDLNAISDEYDKIKFERTREIRRVMRKVGYKKALWNMFLELKNPKK